MNKVLLNDVFGNFTCYPAINSYTKSTRNENILLKIPKLDLNLQKDCYASDHQEHQSERMQKFFVYGRFLLARPK